MCLVIAIAPTRNSGSKRSDLTAMRALRSAESCALSSRQSRGGTSLMLLRCRKQHGEDFKNEAHIDDGGCVEDSCCRRLSADNRQQTALGRHHGLKRVNCHWGLKQQ